MGTIICPRCHGTNTSTTTLYHCQYCGGSIKPNHPLTTKEQKDIVRRLILGNILLTGLVLLFGLLVPDPFYWIALACGTTMGLLYAKHRFRRWSDYTLSSAKWAVRRWNIVSRVAYFLFLFLFLLAFNLIFREIPQPLNRFFRTLVVGLLLGCMEGFYLWPLWLYLHRDKAIR